MRFALPSKVGSLSWRSKQNAKSYKKVLSQGKRVTPKGLELIESNAVASRDHAPLDYAPADCAADKLCSRHHNRCIHGIRNLNCQLFRLRNVLQNSLNLACALHLQILYKARLGL